MANFQFSVRVFYEDTDAGGVVYYANYLKFFERARTEWLRCLGFEQQKLAQEQSIFFVVRKVETEYFASARLDDLLDVSVQIEKLGRVAVEFIQEIHCNGVLLTRCRTKVACVSGERFKPCALPEPVRTAMQDALVI
jgi:acyl-CoA thioester hydrolase